MEVLISILFGIVEGVTEWLPVSSTGHMIVLNELIPLSVGSNPEGFYSMFEVVIQLGAILAVVLLYFGKLWPFGRKNNNNPLGDSSLKSYIKKDIFILWIKVLVSCIPAAVIGLLFDDLFEELFYNYTTVAIMLILVGILFIVVENMNKNKEFRVDNYMDITYRDALIIGLFQVVAAILPGTSRSGATIVGALLIGISRGAAAEYTFFLAIPVMFGASLLKIVKYGLSFTGYELLVLGVGTVVSFIVSIIVIKLLLGYIKKHDFKPFGIYRIVLGGLIFASALAGII